MVRRYEPLQLRFCWLHLNRFRFIIVFFLLWPLPLCFFCPYLHPLLPQKYQAFSAVQAIDMIFLYVDQRMLVYLQRHRTTGEYQPTMGVLKYLTIERIKQFVNTWAIGETG